MGEHAPDSPFRRGRCRRRRSLEKALAELQANYRKRPSATLARMIEQLRAELTFRKER
jgi:hypothetical protein